MIISARLLFLLALAWPMAVSADERLTIASTTSTDHSGLYEYLLPIYEQKSGVQFRVIAVGTGQAIRNAMRGDADLLIVHHRSSEEQFVRDGYGLERHDLMYNDFVIVGPKDDPAQVAQAQSVPEVLHRIAGIRFGFVSRGDDSGTHKRELELWRTAGIDVEAGSGEWYWEAGAGMGPTLNVAASTNAYTLTDRATWTAFGNRKDLQILYQKDPLLNNQYGVIIINPERHLHVQHELAANFVAWLLSEAGQQVISKFQINGVPVFFPNAVAQ